MEGILGNIFVDLIQHADHQGARQKINANREEGKKANKNAVATKCITSGVMFKLGQVRLNSNVLEEAANHHAMKKEEEDRKKNKKDCEIKKRREAVKAICTLGKETNPEAMSVDELKTLIQYKKHKGDEKMPAGKADLVEQYKQTRHRTSPPSSPVHNHTGQQTINSAVDTHLPSLESLTDDQEKENVPLMEV
jgi:hypothetical protein